MYVWRSWLCSRLTREYQRRTAGHSGANALGGEGERRWRGIKCLQMHTSMQLFQRQTACERATPSVGSDCRKRRRNLSPASQEAPLSLPKPPPKKPAPRKHKNKEKTPRPNTSTASLLLCPPAPPESTSLSHPPRQVPVAAAGLAPCLGDVALVRVVTRECGDRAATVLEKHLREKAVASWAAEGVEGWGVGLAGGGGGGGDAGGTAEGNAAAAAEVLGKADALLEELAVLTQHTESYDRFVKFLVMEVRGAPRCGTARRCVWFVWRRGRGSRELAGFVGGGEVGVYSSVCAGGVSHDGRWGGGVGAH